MINYAQGMEPFRMTDRLSASERAMLMGGACAKAYKWEPKRGRLTASIGRVREAVACPNQNIENPMQSNTKGA